MLTLLTLRRLGHRGFGELFDGLEVDDRANLRRHLGYRSGLLLLGCGFNHSNGFNHGGNGFGLGGNVDRDHRLGYFCLNRLRLGRCFGCRLLGSSRRTCNVRLCKTCLDDGLTLLLFGNRVDGHSPAMLESSLARRALLLDLFTLLLSNLQFLGKLLMDDVDHLVRQNGRRLILDLESLGCKVFYDRITTDVDLTRELEKFISC